MADEREIEAQLAGLFSDIELSATPEENLGVFTHGLIEADVRKEIKRQGTIFQALVENAIDAIFVSDSDGHQTYSNRACYDLFGYDCDCQEMRGLPLANLWPKEDVHVLTGQVLPQARAGGWNGEARLKRRDGVLFDAYLTAFPIVLDGNGQSIGIATTIRDISERKAVEREKMYDRRARQVRLITEVSQKITAAPNLDELYRRVVNTVKERLGYYHVRIFRHDASLNDLVLVERCTQAGEETTGPEGARGRGAVATVAVTGQSVLISDALGNHDWEPHPGLPDARGELAVPIKLGDQLLGVLDVLSDTAGALTREDEILLMDLAGQVASAIENARLLEEANILRQFAKSSEGIGWITLEGGLFIYINPTLCTLLGEVRPEDAFGKPIVTYCPSELRQRVRDEVLPTAIREGQWVGELALVSVRGKVVPTMQSFFLVRDEEETPLYLANVVTDITEQKQVEFLVDKRAKQISCLNDIGKKTEAAPEIPDFLSWVAGRIPQAMLHPDSGLAAIEFEEQVYGAAAALDLPDQIVRDLRVRGEVVGRVIVSYQQGQDFDEDGDLVGDIARRVSSYIESYRLSEWARVRLEEVRSTHQLYKPDQWFKRVHEPVPAEEPVQPVVAPSSDAGLKARLRSGRIYAAMQKLWRHVSTRLFVLVLMPSLLVGGVLVTRSGLQPQVEPQALVAVTATVPSHDALGVTASPSFPTPTSDLAFISPLTGLSATVTYSPPSPTPSLTPVPPTASPTLLPTPTSAPPPIGLEIVTPFPTLGPEIIATASALISDTLPIPAPVQPVPVGSDVINIVVLGSDQRPDWSQWHTDAVHVVSIQRDRGTVSLISIPRDLYIYVPGFWMSRINFADFYGESYSYEGGGVALMRDTLLYNLGIRTDRYIRTDFDGLIGIVDILGGIDIPVHCRLSDHWPYPDEDGEYPILTMEPGIQHMDGETALWYARSRMTSSVFSREWRQQQVLQTLWHKVRDDLTLSQVPGLWEQAQEMVETDLTFTDVLDLARVAFAQEDQNVRFYNINAGEVTPWVTTHGGSVFLPRWEAIQPMVAEAMGPASEARMNRTYLPVEVWNGTSNQDWDLLAVDRLYRDGFPAVVGEADRRDYAQTQLILFSGSVKGSGVDYVQRLFNIPDSQVIHQPDDASPFGFRLIVGADYQTCPQP